MPADIYFAGGGTGGHIYPALAIAQQILKVEPDANITFFCSDREIDSQILSKTGFELYSAVRGRFFGKSDSACEISVGNAQKL